MNILRKKTAILAFVLVVALTFCGLFLFTRWQNQGDVMAQTTAEQYVIGEYKEKIAVFAQNDRIPIEVFDIYVSTLPQKDQQDLKKGVKVVGKLKLKERIEDYTS